MQNLKENSSGSEKKRTLVFPDNLREEFDKKFSITQNDCQHTDFYSFVNCVTTYS